MSKIFITGGSGFLGRNFVQTFQNSHEIYQYHRGESLRRAVVKFTPDYILHFAGEIYNEEVMLTSNILLTHELLQSSLTIPYKAFIYIGSSSEYGRKQEPMKETDFLDPTTMYEATKACGTLLAQAFARKFGKPIMIARPFSVYGPLEGSHRFIPTILRCLKEGKTLNLASGVHDFIYVDDFIAGLKTLMNNPAIGEIYNIGTGTQWTNKQVVELVEDLAKKPLKVNQVGKMRSFDSNCWVADNSKLRGLGWAPRTELYQGLSKLLLFL